MSSFTSSLRFFCAHISLSLLYGCGGGGSESTATQSASSSVSISFSTSSLTFQAQSIYQVRPASQNVVATLSGSAPSSTLYLLVDVADPQLVTVGNISITGPTTGQATITPVTTATVRDRNPHHHHYCPCMPGQSYLCEWPDSRQPQNNCRYIHCAFKRARRLGHAKHTSRRARR